MMVCPSGSIAVTGRNLDPGDVIDLPAPPLRATFGQVEALTRTNGSSNSSKARRGCSSGGP
jgi:hypothetical protein